MQFGLSRGLQLQLWRPFIMRLPDAGGRNLRPLLLVGNQLHPLRDLLAPTLHRQLGAMQVFAAALFHLRLIVPPLYLSIVNFPVQANIAQ
jgi:hypothetical protein